MYSCPQDSCICIFQKLSAIQKHLSLEKCTRVPEKHYLMDMAKKEGVEKLPLLQAPVRQEKSFVSLKEGWALQVVKKAYRFSEK